MLRPLTQLKARRHSPGAKLRMRWTNELSATSAAASRILSMNGMRPSAWRSVSVCAPEVGW